MSLWRHVTKALHTVGGRANLRDFEDFSVRGDFRAGLQMARQHGLIKTDMKSERHPETSEAIWSLTELGWDWCEGRVIEKEFRATPTRMQPAPWRGLRFVATWLSSLPKDIRILPPGELPCSLA